MVCVEVPSEKHQVVKGRTEHSIKWSIMGRAWNPMDEEGMLCAVNTLLLLLTHYERVLTFEVGL